MATPLLERHISTSLTNQATDMIFAPGAKKVNCKIMCPEGVCRRCGEHTVMAQIKIVVQITLYDGESVVPQSGKSTIELTQSEYTGSKQRITSTPELLDLAPDMTSLSYLFVRNKSDNEIIDISSSDELDEYGVLIAPISIWPGEFGLVPSGSLALYAATRGDAADLEYLGVAR